MAYSNRFKQVNQIFAQQTLVRLINKTGSASVIGSIVSVSSTTDGAFMLNPIDGDMPIGVVTEVVAADALCYICVSGIVPVLLVDSVATTRSYVGFSSASVSGRVDTSATVPAAIQHFREIGHTLESKSAGTNVLVKMVVHFN